MKTRDRIDLLIELAAENQRLKQLLADSIERERLLHEKLIGLRQLKINRFDV